MDEKEVFDKCNEGKILKVMIQMVDPNSRNVSFTLRRSQLLPNFSGIELGIIESKEELAPDPQNYEFLSLNEKIKEEGERFLSNLENSSQFKNPHALMCLINHYHIVENFSIIKPKRAKKKKEDFYYYDQLRAEQSKIVADSL